MSNLRTPRKLKPRYSPEQLYVMPLSALLRLAVKDAIEAKKRGYILDMYTYHQPTGKTCSVCLAGAVLGQSCGFDPKAAWHPFDSLYSPVQLFAISTAIDNMRGGRFRTAMSRLGREQTEQTAATCDAAANALQSYSGVSGRAPWREYLRAARILEKGGL